MQDKLFRSVPTATLLRTPRKLPPKTPLEKYVLENLPAQIRLHSNDKLPLEDIAASQQQLLSSEGARIKAISDLSAAREVQLDLVMMLGVYLLLRDRAFTVAPPILLELLETNAGRHAITKRMTYELIVDVNTEAFLRTNGQIRIFSYGDIGLIERDFYIGHHFAEKHIKDAYEMLREVVQEPGLPNKTERLQAVLTGLQEFTKYMAIFAHLKPDAYAYFRRFLVPYPDKVKNGSGAFMPSPQLFEMLLHKPGYAQTQHVTTNEQYFSQWAQPLLHSQREAAEGGQTVEALLEKGALRLSQPEAKLLHAIVEQFVRFKLTHIKVASSKIPEAFPNPPTLEREELRGFCPFLGATRDAVGKQEGTGGFVPQDFLGDGVNRLLELQQRLLKLTA